MKIGKVPDANIDLVYLDDKFGLPHCKEHGAMNKMTPDGIWRCVSQYKKLPTADKKPGRFIDNNCKAGCQELGL